MADGQEAASALIVASPQGLVTASPRELVFQSLEKAKRARLGNLQKEEIERCALEAANALQKIVDARYYGLNVKNLPKDQFGVFCNMVHKTSNRRVWTYGSILSGCILAAASSWFIGPTAFTALSTTGLVLWFVISGARAFLLSTGNEKDFYGEGLGKKSFLWDSAKYFHFIKHFGKLARMTSRDEAHKRIQNKSLHP